MTMTRREFLVTGVIVASPILVNAVPRVFGEHCNRLEPRHDDVILKIAGWDSGDDDPNVVWLVVGPSWRTAWC
jgi:hypothetical protein